jgi:hypothetical protein
MPPVFDEQRSEDDAEGPDGLLDRLRQEPDWDHKQRAAVFEQLIARFPPERLVAAVRDRFDDLDHADADAILQVVEAFGDTDLLSELAAALVRQTVLSPERAWGFLLLLESAGVLEEYPELIERFEEIGDSIDEGAMSLTELAERLEEDPEEIWVALHGLAAVEPEVRAEIVEGLGEIALGHGGIELLRLLIFAHDPQLRATAIEALERQTSNTDVEAAWLRIASEHDDAAIVERAHAHLPTRSTLAPLDHETIDQTSAPVSASVVTSLDGRGQGYIVFGTEHHGDWSVAAFLCDVMHGVRDVVGHSGVDVETARVFMNEFATITDRDAVEGAHATALALFSGSAALCGPSSPPTIRYWLERTVGPATLRGSLPALLPEVDADADDLDEALHGAHLILESCETWFDDSDLTYELAEELLLREKDPAPDPVRDSGAFRFLFENRLVHRLELDRRMLVWMASFWSASEEEALARSALALSRQLADAESVVPGQPFPTALAARSLSVAQANLRNGIDLRDPATRARVSHHAAD